MQSIKHGRDLLSLALAIASCLNISSIAPCLADDSQTPQTPAAPATPSPASPQAVELPQPQAPDFDWPTEPVFPEKKPAAGKLASPPVPDPAATAAAQAASPASVTLQPIKLANSTSEPISHDDAKTLHLSPLYLSRAIEMNSFEALRHETAVDQEITLKDAINYVLDQGMQIKVSRESINYQHILTLSGLASFLPSYSTSYNITFANVYNDYTQSLAQTFQTGAFMPVFQGGQVLYSLLAQRYRERAWREAYTGTVSDVFLDVYTKYTNLILQRVLLQTWAKAVEADEEQLKYARKQLDAGTGTRYAIMQVEALLATDRQSFLRQAVTMRQAGLTLNAALNYPLEVNLVPAERTLTETTLFDQNVPLKTLLRDSLKYSSGLRQYEDFRLAAARIIQAQSSALYPNVSFFALYQVNNASVSPAANGAALGGAATSAIDNFLDTSFAGRVSNNALGQQYTFSPTAGSTSTQGANTAPVAMPAASGGTPIAQVQSGSLVSSGAVAPSIFGGGNGGGSGPNANGSFQAPAGIFPGDFREFQAGFSMNWTLPNFGLQTTSQIVASKLLARQALMQCNQELSVVSENVRSDYLSILAARQAIDQAATATIATREAMRYARARLQNGVATWLDLIRSQHDYIAALTTQAQAIGNSNIAQAQLLHDMGMINATTLTRGYQPGVFSPSIPTGKKRWYKP